jgi:isocitrate lyase
MSEIIRKYTARGIEVWRGSVLVITVHSEASAEIVEKNLHEQQRAGPEPSSVTARD